MFDVICFNAQISGLDIVSFILPLSVRTLTQEDHGDNQITLEDVTQLVSVSVYSRAAGRQNCKTDVKTHLYVCKSTRPEQFTYMMEKMILSSSRLPLMIFIKGPEYKIQCHIAVRM